MDIDKAQIIENEIQLYEQIREGDRKSFELLFRKYFPRLRSFALRITSDEEVANDLVQDLFLRLWESHQQIDKDKSLKAWLFLSLRNSSLNFLRKQKVEQRYLEYVNFQSNSQELFLSNFLEEGEIEQLRNEAFLQVTEIIGSLSPQCKRVFEMSRLQGMKNADIAQELNISIRTVETHISNAIKTIGKQLKQQPKALLLVALIFLGH